MGIPKHFAQVKGEELIARTVRILHGEISGVEIIVTSHDERYEFPGSRRYEPLNNIYEIDRFTRELITENMCFLYGDTFYTEEAASCMEIHRSYTPLPDRNSERRPYRIPYSKPVYDISS